jgi:hypothetical protein
MKVLIGIVSAVGGALVGAAATYIVMKKKCDKRINTEIESVKKAYGSYIVGADLANVSSETVEETVPEVVEEPKPVAPKRYSSDATKETVVDEPYVISPSEFGSEEDYECITLQYYADEVLADDWDEIIDDWEEVAGKEFYKKFGEYEDDVVYVRNKRLKCDYEICRNEQYYYVDIMPNKNRRVVKDD